MTETHRLRHSARLRTGPLVLGIVAMSPDPQDRAVRLDVIDHDSGFGEIVEAREGEAVDTGAHRIRFAEVSPGDWDGCVVLEIEPGTEGERR